jgi:spore germination protein GerM
MKRSTVLGHLVAIGALLVSACGVQPDGSPRDLPEAEQVLAPAGGSSGDTAQGADRIYLIAPGDDRLLRSVQREAQNPTELISTLLRGPNDSEIEAQFSTAIPSTTTLNGDVRRQGQTLIVDLSDDIIELDTQSLSRAVAQIVYTATELEEIETVQIEIDGERLSAPTPDGDTTQEPLSVFAFPGAVLTSQPAYPAAAVSGGT